MTTLRLDTENHTLEVSADLVGETQPIEAKVGYRLEQTPEGLSFVPTRIDCSRPWIQMLATQMLADGSLRLPVPPGLASTVVRMLKV